MIQGEPYSMVQESLACVTSLMTESEAYAPALLPSIEQLIVESEAYAPNARASCSLRLNASHACQVLLPSIEQLIVEREAYAPHATASCRSRLKGGGVRAKRCCGPSCSSSFKARHMCVPRVAASCRS